jgi:hypothetical protein
MQSFAWKAITFVVASGLSACGASSVGATKKGVPVTAAPVSSQKDNLPKTNATQSQKEALQVFGPVVGVRSGQGNCNGIVVQKDVVLLPSHCIESSAPSFPINAKVKVIKIERVNPGIEGTEDLIKVTIQVPSDVFAQPIDTSKVLAPAELPSASRLSLMFDFGGITRELPCFVVTYTPAKALGYQCDTSAGHSGSLVTDRNGSPFAVHLGRKDGLGYGVLLATVLPRPTSSSLSPGDSK